MGGQNYLKDFDDFVVMNLRIFQLKKLYSCFGMFYRFLFEQVHI